MEDNKFTRCGMSGAICCEACLLANLQHGQSDVVWGMWYERDRPFLLAYVQRRVTGSAEDIVQNTFMTAFVNIKNGRFTYTGKPLRAYLIGIAKNLIRETYRINKRENTELPDAYQLDSCELSLELKTVLKEHYSFIHTAWHALSPQQQEVLYLTYAKGNSSAQVADALGLSRENARIIAMRGVQQIQHRLQRDYNVELSANGVRLGLETLVMETADFHFV